MAEDTNNPWLENEAFLSRTQRKAVMAEIGVFARELVEMIPAKFDRLVMSPELRRAIETARDITSHAARKRQMKKVEQFLADEDIPAMKKAILKIDHARVKKPAPAPLSVEEQLACNLVQGGDDELFALVDRLDREQLSQLRNLIRKAQRAVEAGKDLKAEAKPVAEFLRLYPAPSTNQ